MSDQGQAALIADFVQLRVWAVVGVSANPQKFGHRIHQDLLAAGYCVYGVNPQTREVKGQPVYPSLDTLPERPDVVNVVVPPQAALEVLQDCARLGLRRVWLQPGAESPAALRYCREQGIAVVHHACAMVEKKRWPLNPG